MGSTELADGAVTDAKITGPISAAKLDLTGVVSKSGDTMTGALTLPANGLAIGTNQLVASGGNVGIGTATPIERLDVNGNIRINDADVYLRADRNHGLGWYGTGKLFAGANVNGPALYGDTGGVLGTTGGGRGQQAALMWDVNANVTIPGNLILSSGTSTMGIIYSGATTLIHTTNTFQTYGFGNNNFFVGPGAGNLRHMAMEAIRL